MSKKTNPRRRPASKQEVKQAFQDGIERTLQIVCFVLKEKSGFTDEQLAKFNKDFDRYLESINNGDISESELRAAMLTDYNLEVEVT